MRASRGWQRGLERFGPLLALAALVLVVSILSPDFRKPENALNIVRQMSFVGIVAVGMTYVIILGGIDLSVGSMVAMLAGLGVFAMNAACDAGAGAWAGVAVAAGLMLIGGPLLGLLNGLTITLGRVAPFIATLGGMAIYRSVILAVADGAEIRSGVPEFGTVSEAGFDLPLLASSRGEALEVTVPVIAFALVAVAAQIVLRKTALGLRIYAIGDNPTAARYAGLPIARVTLVVYAVAGLTCGIAALLNSSRLNSVSSSSLGSLYELNAIAAVVIGGTRMSGGAGSVAGTVIGVLILGVVSNMLTMLQVSTHLQDMVKGCIIIAAVLIQRSARDH